MLARCRGCGEHWLRAGEARRGHHSHPRGGHPAGAGALEHLVSTAPPTHSLPCLTLTTAL